jgi:hypothetical protein
VLIILAVAALDIMGLFAIASFRGVDVELWGAKIGHYEPAAVTNCTKLIENLTALAAGLERQIGVEGPSVRKRTVRNENTCCIPTISA